MRYGETGDEAEGIHEKMKAGVAQVSSILGHSGYSARLWNAIEAHWVRAGLGLAKCEVAVVSHCPVQLLSFTANPLLSPFA
jgi:nitric oxide reductase large subunit